jgi:Ala-tRNA(Pro) deacylase
MTHSTFLQIKKLLDDNHIKYAHYTHKHVHTSQDAAAIRNTNLDDAAKAIVLKVVRSDGREEFIQCVIQASKKIDLKKLKQLLNVNNAALASPDEVLKKTGCTVGSVPPFGILFGIPVYMDDGLLTRNEIVFSAGTHNDSIQMNPHDYVTIVRPEIVELKKE